MAGQYPPIEPFETGMLDTGDGHQVYWEASGNPNGKPALFLHGGPGSGCSVNQRRFFDPAAYRIVLFDQRGSGRSRPLASEPNADLSTNTTQHLIADIEALRELNGADRWTILGVSWGSTLALAYAETYPVHVNAIILGFVTSTSRAEVEWITQGVSRIFPEEWERFTDAIPERLKHLRPVDAYAQMLLDPDPDRYATVPRAPGAPGRTPTSPSRLATSPARAMRTRSSACVSHDWSRTTGARTPSLVRIS